MIRDPDPPFHTLLKDTLLEIRRDQEKRPIYFTDHKRYNYRNQCIVQVYRRITEVKAILPAFVGGLDRKGIKGLVPRLPYTAAAETFYCLIINLFLLISDSLVSTMTMSQPAKLHDSLNDNSIINKCFAKVMHDMFFQP